jgi:hypothetical protein
VKQVESDLHLILVDLNNIFTTNRNILKDITLSIPNTPKDLENIMKLMETQSASKQLDRDRLRESYTKTKSNIAAKDALLLQHQQKYTQLKTKLQQFDSIEQFTNGIIDRLNLLRGNKVLSDSGLDPLPYHITSEDLLLQAKATEDEARELLVIAKAGKAYLKRLKKERQKNPNQCPCCGQTMNSPTIMETFDKNIETLFSFGQEEAHGTIEENKETLDQASNLFQQIQSMQQQLIPLSEIRQESFQLEKSIATLQTEKRDLIQQLQTIELTLPETETMFDHITRVFHHFQELLLRWKSLEQRKIEYLDRQKRQTEHFLLTSSSSSSIDIGGGASSSSSSSYQHRSLEELENLQQQRQEEKDALQVKKEKLTNDENILMKRFYAMKNQLTEKEKLLNDAKLEHYRSEELEVALQQLQSKLTDNEQRKMTLNRERDQHDRELREYSLQYNNKKLDYTNKEKQWQEQLQIIQMDREKLTQYDHSIDDLSLRLQSIANTLEIQGELDQIEQAIVQKEQDVKQWQIKMNSLQQELLSAEHIKRNIVGNIELREYELELITLREEWNKFEQRHLSKNYLEQVKQSEKEQLLLTREKQSLTSERDTLRGKMEVHRQHCLDIEKKLNHSTYRGIDERCRIKNIELETTNKVINDLDNYYNAL